MNDMYLVTGAAGHLGSTLINELLKRGKTIRMFLLPSEKNFADKHPDVEAVFGNVCDSDSLEKLFYSLEGRDIYVIHAAGIVTIASKYNQAVYDVNVLGTRNITSLCEKYRVKRFIYVSSVHAIPEKPENQLITEISSFDPGKVKGLYAKTKAQATQIVLNAAENGLNACVVHPSGIIGPNDSGKGHLTQLVIDYLKGRLTAVVKGGYDFVDVRDVADGILSCCEKGQQGECYILSNDFFDIKGFLKTLWETCGKLSIFETKKIPRQIKTVLPSWFAQTTAPLAELYYRLLKQPPLYTAYSLQTLTANGHFTHKKADSFLQYHTRPITTTLKDTVLWLGSQNRF